MNTAPMLNIPIHPLSKNDSSKMNSSKIISTWQTASSMSLSTSLAIVSITPKLLTPRHILFCLLPLQQIMMMMMTMTLPPPPLPSLKVELHLSFPLVSYIHITSPLHGAYFTWAMSFWKSTNELSLGAENWLYNEIPIECICTAGGIVSKMFIVFSWDIDVWAFTLMHMTCIICIDGLISVYEHVNS